MIFSHHKKDTLSFEMLPLKSFRKFSSLTNQFSETFEDSEKVANIKRFLNFHPTVGAHFQSRVKIDQESEEEEKGAAGEDNHDRTTTMFEMHRKTLRKALFNYETVNELNERKLSYTFGPKVEYGERKTYEMTQKEFMEHIDDLRSHETYKHDECSKACSDRGCKSVLVIDGNWKLRYPICMFNTEHAYPSELTKFLPNVCTESPNGENAFCRNHCATADKLGLPKKLSEFLTYCGANPKQYNIEGKGKVQTVLKQMADAAGKACSFVDTQNTSYLLRNRTIANQQNFSAETSTEPGCHKDLGEKTVHKLTRSHISYLQINGRQQNFLATKSIPISMKASNIEIAMLYVLMDIFKMIILP